MFDHSMFLLVFACISAVVWSTGKNLYCFLVEVTLLNQDFEVHFLCLQIYVTSAFFFFVTSVAYAKSLSYDHVRLIGVNLE